MRQHTYTEKRKNCSSSRFDLFIGCYSLYITVFDSFASCLLCRSLLVSFSRRFFYSSLISYACPFDKSLGTLCMKTYPLEPLRFLYLFLCPFVFAFSFVHLACFNVRRVDCSSFFPSVCGWGEKRVFLKQARTRASRNRRYYRSF